MPVNLAGSMPHCSLGLAGYRIQAQRELPVAFEHAVLAASSYATCGAVSLNFSGTRLNQTSRAR
jgi:hypothetical protein